MKPKRGWRGLETRVAQLIKKNGKVPPHEVLQLLKRADGNPKIDIEKEISILSEQHKDNVD